MSGGGGGGYCNICTSALPRRNGTNDGEIGVGWSKGAAVTGIGERSIPTSRSELDGTGECGRYALLIVAIGVVAAFGVLTVLDRLTFGFDSVLTR